MRTEPLLRKLCQKSCLKRRGSLQGVLLHICSCDSASGSSKKTVPQENSPHRLLQTRQDKDEMLESVSLRAKSCANPCAKAIPSFCLIFSLLKTQSWGRTDGPLNPRGKRKEAMSRHAFGGPSRPRMARFSRDSTLPMSDTEFSLPGLFSIRLEPTSSGDVIAINQ